jgi:curved DNA-binding protein CbpA
MSLKSDQQNYYQVLEVSPSAQHHEVVAAYNRAKEAYSSDSAALYTMFTAEEAKELRSLIEEAFLILGNQGKRKAYDQLLVSKGSPATPTTPVPAATPNGTRALPDFAPQENRRNEKPSGATSTPNTLGKSRLSTYEVKAEVESEIINQKNFDGLFFKKIRQYKNINLEQLSKETRISKTYIAAIEAEEFSALPAPVFLRGFLIQLARILGLDENTAASSYLSRIKKDK